MVPNEITETSVLITGALGFLGKPLVLSLARKGYTVYALDILPPIKEVIDEFSSFPNIHIITADIADVNALQTAFNHRIDFILHLGAYWTFDIDESHQATYDRVNGVGTENIFKLAEKHNVKRVIFASSISALSHSAGDILNEKTPVDPTSKHPYGWSKAKNELAIQHLFSKPSQTSVAIVRLTGVFHPVRCELPPLSAVIMRWKKISPLGNIIPGKGDTGLSYLSVDDFLDMMLAIMTAHPALDACETFIAAHPGYTSHNELFPIIRKSFGYSTRPLHLPLSLVKLGFLGETFLRKLFFLDKSIERAWMFDLVDKPYNVNTTYTEQKLQWKPKPERHILNALPVMIKEAKKIPSAWTELQKERLHSNYLKAISQPLAKPNLSMYRRHLFFATIMGVGGALVLNKMTPKKS